LASQSAAVTSGLTTAEFERLRTWALEVADFLAGGIATKATNGSFVAPAA